MTPLIFWVDEQTWGHVSFLSPFAVCKMEIILPFPCCFSVSLSLSMETNVYTLHTLFSIFKWPPPRPFYGILFLSLSLVCVCLSFSYFISFFFSWLPVLFDFSFLSLPMEIREFCSFVDRETVCPPHKGKLISFFSWFASFFYDYRETDLIVSERDHCLWFECCVESRSFLRKSQENYFLSMWRMSSCHLGTKRERASV